MKHKLLVLTLLLAPGYATSTEIHSVVDCRVKPCRVFEGGVSGVSRQQEEYGTYDPNTHTKRSTTPERSVSPEERSVAPIARSTSSTSVTANPPEWRQHPEHSGWVSRDGRMWYPKNKVGNWQDVKYKKFPANNGGMEFRAWAGVCGTTGNPCY